MLLDYACLFIAILIGVGGQLTLKTGSLSAAAAGTSPFFHPITILGLAAYFISALFYIYSLKRIPVSVAFPSVSLSYVAVALLAHLIWQEPIHWQHIFAFVFIISGVCLLVSA